MANTKHQVKKTKEQITEFWSYVLGGISLLAILGLLVRAQFDPNEILSSIINFTQVGIPVVVLIIMSRNRTEAKSFLDIGIEALSRLKSDKKYIRIGYSAKKMNKKSNSEDSDQTDVEHGEQYMFVTAEKGALESKLIPLSGLQFGELAIYAQKGMLVYVRKWSSSNATDEEVKILQNKISEGVEELIKKKYNGLFELKDREGEKGLAIFIDFDEYKMGRRKYFNAVYECAEKAYEIIKNYPSKP